MNLSDKSFFTSKLMHWNILHNGRKMPWKGEKNPYRIWLSEIILQQTRVEQGLDYYNRFIKKYPTIQQLAGAPETEIFKLWEGLGYYTRCRNLIATARDITGRLKGRFPEDYADILRLKGVGPYTAAAIASFAYDLPYAVVDGNVYRVLSRYFGISTAIDTSEGKKYFAALASDLLDRSAPGLYNQGIMDLGATICKPVPLCADCPLQKKCKAYKTDMINAYPVKEKKPARKVRWLYYFIAEYENRLLIKKREGKDIWQNLHEFVLVENDRELDNTELSQSTILQKMAGKKPVILDISEAYVQHLTHQTIKGRFIHVKLVKKPQLAGYRLEARSSILKLAFPKYITGYFKDSRVLMG